MRKKNLRILPFKICMLSECVEIGRFRWKTDLFIGYFFFVIIGNSVAHRYLDERKRKILF